MSCSCHASWGTPSTVSTEEFKKPCREVLETVILPISRAPLAVRSPRNMYLPVLFGSCISPKCPHLVRLSSAVPCAVLLSAGVSELGVRKSPGWSKGQEGPWLCNPVIGSGKERGHPHPCLLPERAEKWKTHKQDLNQSKHTLQKVLEGEESFSRRKGKKKNQSLTEPLDKAPFFRVPPSVLCYGE